MTVNSSLGTFTRSSNAAAGTPRLYLREDELDNGVSMILGAAQKLKSATSAQRKAFGLTWSETRCLLQAMGQSIPVLVMATALDLTKQTILKTLEALEGRGLILRTNDTQDGRRKLVTLTQEGLVLAQDLALALRVCLAGAYKGAGSEAVAGCDKVLTILTQTQNPPSRSGPTS
ncbi:winged helix DNA-binding protein [Candidatus Phycosocius spiralis]|uniref:HTH marR-type domain-containing protein n=1 Tax=Candidatus Phycosocius spiralis TaxID=2815099 RepID=A0ABQ4PWR3_9PROT|nr:winged helix DNA-binding protein [Candidatus Phycosocius spiralis]GIU67500.1 hypothetical protein PsB1_1654 [Candidatus Phycosocius spiralis]